MEANNICYGKMDLTAPSSLIQFLNNATSSVRAALERPMGDKGENASNVTQEHVFPCQSPTRERRRYKTHSRRRRNRNQTQRQVFQSDYWRDGYNNHPQALGDLLGMPDPCVQGASQEPHHTQWEDQLQWSPNVNRECSDDSVASPGMGDWQTQYNGDLAQAGGGDNASCMYSDQQVYQPKTKTEAYTLVSKSHYSYDNKSSPKSLEDVFNMMPVGCHLPPPLPVVCSYKGNHQPQEVDTVSQKMIPQILRIAEKKSLLHPPRIANPRERHIPPVPLAVQAQNNSCDMDLLSQLVTELDKTNTLDKLTEESSACMQTSKELTVEELRDLSRDCTNAAASSNGNYLVGLTGSGENMSNISEWGKCGLGSKRHMLGNKSSSLDLACALEDTHIVGMDSPTNQINNTSGSTATNYQNENFDGDFIARKRAKTLRRSASAVGTLHIGTALEVSDRSNMETQTHDRNRFKRDKASLLMAMHERKSMPNLYPSPRSKYVNMCESDNTTLSLEFQSLGNLWEDCNGSGISNENGHCSLLADHNISEATCHSKQWSQITQSVVPDVYNQSQSPKCIQGTQWNIMNARINHEDANQDQSNDVLQQNRDRIGANPYEMKQVQSPKSTQRRRQWIGMNAPIKPNEFNHVQPQTAQHQATEWSRVNPSVNSDEFNNFQSSETTQLGRQLVEINPSVNSEPFNQMHTPNNLYHGNATVMDSHNIGSIFNDSRSWTTNVFEDPVQKVSSNFNTAQWQSYNTETNHYMNSDLLTNYDRTDIQFNNSMSNDDSVWPSEEEEDDFEEDEEDAEEENSRTKAQGRIDAFSSTSVVQLPSFSSVFLQK